MLGGSLHPLVLKALAKGTRFNEQFVLENSTVLKNAGYSLGVHRGIHYDRENCKSDCGFADNLPNIIQKAKDSKEEITNRLLAVFDRYSSSFDGVSKDEFKQTIDSAYAKIVAFDPDHITCIGDALISLEETYEHADVEHLEGDHNEVCVFVNLKTNTTLDTESGNARGLQAFNLDLWAVVEQSRVLGVDSSFARAASLILYQATEMVLVEDKGKQALQIYIHY